MIIRNSGGRNCAWALLAPADRRCLGMLDGILIGLAVLCVVYFIIIVVYAGISTSFAFIWLFFAALLVFLVYGKMVLCQKYGTIPHGAGVSSYHLYCGGGLCWESSVSWYFWEQPRRERPIWIMCDCARGQGQGTYGQQFPEKASDRAIVYAEENPYTIWCSPAARGRGIRQRGPGRDYLTWP